MNNSEFFTGEYNLVVKYPPGVNPKTAAPIRGVDTRNRQFWTNINWDMDSIGVEYIGSYRTYTAEGGVYLTTLGQDVSTPYDRFYTNEVRVHSQNNSTLQWQAGVVHYANGLRDHNKIYTVATGALSNETFTDKKTTALGAFGEATYHLTDVLRLTGGLRYDDTEVRNSEVFTPASTVTPLVGGTPRTIDGNGEGRRAFHEITYKARIEYDLTPSNMVYVSTATGTSPGDVALANNGSGANATPTVTAFDAETNTAYELGSKNRFLNNRLQVNVALYHQEYGGFQTAVNTNAAVTPAIYTSVTTPITSYGGEFELIARPWQGGTLGFNMAYTHAEYHDIDPSGAQYFGLSEVRSVVPFQTSLSLDQEYSLWSNAVDATAMFVTSAYDAGRITVLQANNGLRPYQRNESEVFGNVSTTLEFADRYTLTAYCRNVGDKRQLTGTFTIISNTPTYTPGPLPFASGERYTAPRTFGLVATAKF
jgi:iron complex outermembrane receptor protein